MIYIHHIESIISSYSSNHSIHHFQFFIPEIANFIDAPRQEAEVLRNLGEVAQARENLAVAEEHFEEAVVLLRENELTGDAFDGFAELIDVCEQRGAKSRAIEFAERTEQTTEHERLQERRSELVTTDE